MLSILAAQGMIWGLCGCIIWRVYRGRVLWSAEKGNMLLYLGGLYLVVMSIRLVIGLTVAPHRPWFGAKTPTFFHLILAMFVILYGHFHLTAASGLKVPSAGGNL